MIKQLDLDRGLWTFASSLRKLWLWSFWPNLSISYSSPDFTVSSPLYCDFGTQNQFYETPEISIQVFS